MIKKHITVQNKLVFLGLLGLLCAQQLSPAKQAESLESLKQQLKECKFKKSQLLRQCDSFNCLKNINQLQSQLNVLEQRTSIAPLKNRMGTIICRMTTTNNKLDQKALCTALEATDKAIQQYNRDNHHLTAPIERRIAELTQKLLNSMPKETKNELKKLLAEYNQLQSKLHTLDPYSQFKARQPHSLELLFI